MIRLIRRRLIIPQGDTGTFTIPTLGTVSPLTDIAIFAIYDPLTRKTIKQKVIPATAETLTFEFAREDTIDIPPSNKYQWDITIYKNAEYDYETNTLIHADEINSYYAAFKLPVCEIRAVMQDV